MNNLTLCSSPSGTGNVPEISPEFQPITLDLTIIVAGGWDLIQDIKEIFDEEDSVGLNDVPRVISIIWKGPRLYKAIKRFLDRFRK